MRTVLVTVVAVAYGSTDGLTEFLTVPADRFVVEVRIPACFHNVQQPGWNPTLPGAVIRFRGQGSSCDQAIFRVTAQGAGTG